jgi:hypothetical protein
MNHAKLLRFTLVVSLLAILVPFAAFGQSSTGAVSGTVTDANGGAMPGVTITATNTATHITRVVTSNSVGHYEAPLLPPGVYRVVAELAGFQTVGATLSINVGTDATWDVKLKPGVAETVTVTAAAPIIETTKTEVSSVVNEKAIQNARGRYQLRGSARHAELDGRRRRQQRQHLLRPDGRAHRIGPRAISIQSGRGERVSGQHEFVLR